MNARRLISAIAGLGGVAAGVVFGFVVMRGVSTDDGYRVPVVDLDAAVTSPMAISGSVSLESIVGDAEAVSGRAQPAASAVGGFTTSGGSGSGFSGDVGLPALLSVLRESGIDFEPDVLPPQFVDLCANDLLEVCPGGIGATVFMPAGGEIPPVFALSPHALVTPDPSWRCPATDLATGEMQVLLMANMPARMSVNYWQSDTGSLSGAASVVVDLTDASHPEHARFLSDPAFHSAESVQHCIVLEGVAASASYTLQVTATPFVPGDDLLIVRPTRVRNYSVSSAALGDRPPAAFTPLDDTSAMAVVHGSVDDGSDVRIRFISETTPASCSDLESTLAADPNPVGTIAWPDGSTVSPTWSTIDLGADFLTSDAWPWDSQFGRVHLVNVPLYEGTNYLACMWWLEDGTVLDREAWLLAGPDLVTTELGVAWVGSQSAQFTLWPDRWEYRTTTGTCSAAFPSVLATELVASGSTTDMDEIRDRIGAQDGSKLAQLYPRRQGDEVTLPDIAFLEAMEMAADELLARNRAEAVSLPPGTWNGCSLSPSVSGVVGFQIREVETPWGIRVADGDWISGYWTRIDNRAHHRVVPPGESLAHDGTIGWQSHAWILPIECMPGLTDHEDCDTGLYEETIKFLAARMVFAQRVEEGLGTNGLDDWVILGPVPFSTSSSVALVTP